MSTVRELRVKLTEQQTLYRNSVERAGEAQARIETMLQQIDPNYIDELLNDRHIDLTVLKTLDLEKAKTDAEYMTFVKNKISAGITQLHEYVEGELNV